MKRTGVALLFVLALPLAIGFTARSARALGEHDQWYALYLSGKKVGHFHEQLSREGENWVTNEEMELSISRMGRPMKVMQESRIIEDAAGRVLSFESAMTAGGMEQKTTGKVEEGKIHLVQMGMESTVDYPEGALGPAAFSRLCEKAGLKPGAKVTAVSFLTDAPTRRVTQTLVVGPKVKRDILGRVLFLHEVTTTNDLLPIHMKAWVDEEWNPWAIELDVPMPGQLTMFATEKEIALAKSEPAEVFATSLIAPDRAIPNPRKLERAVYRLGKKDGVLEGIYEGEGQRILSREGGKLDLEVRAWEPEEGFRAAALPFRPKGMESCLAPNPWIECGDEVVIALAKEAVGEEKDALAAARRIEAYVLRKITKKNLNVGFATAAEVARSLEGDCTEHAVLCCALARAVGMPARVVTGLVYLPPSAGIAGKTGVFGYHMWTEVLVGEGRWYPIDAAIGRFDATHIALAKTDLSGDDPQVEMVLKILPVIGTLTIEVREPAPEKKE